MIDVNWNPMPYLGPIPINWYGLTMALGFLVGGYLVWRNAPRYDVPREKIESLMVWIIAGTIVGARVYFLVQNDFGTYLQEPWRMFAVWEGGLAFFGGLIGATLAAFLFTLKENLSFARVADLFAPFIPIGAAIGRTTCGLAGMDYGTQTTLPWGVVYTNPNSYAPIDGIARHPVQFYELFGDLVIAGILLKLRGRVPDGALFLMYLILFSVLRFFLFFGRGNVDPVAFGLKNAQLTAVAILAVAVPFFVWLFWCGAKRVQTA
jgi:phosphatidylglycerol:prolipoprotein diacylglycerol transferase